MTTSPDKQQTALERCRELIATLPDAELEPHHAEDSRLALIAEDTRNQLLELLTTGDVNAQDYKGDTALNLTCCPGLIRALLAAGAAPRACKDGGTEMLQRPCLPNELISLLLKAGANPNVPDSCDESPLHLACMNDDAQRVNLLLAHGANPHAPWSDQETPLFYAKSAAVAESLIAAGADPNAENIDGVRPLHGANVAVTRVLLAHGAEVQATQLFGVTALALTRSEEKISLLLAAGARLIPQDVEYAARTLFPGEFSGRLGEWVRQRGGVTPAVRQRLKKHHHLILP